MQRNKNVQRISTIFNTQAKQKPQKRSYGPLRGFRIFTVISYGQLRRGVKLLLFEDFFADIGYKEPCNDIDAKWNNNVNQLYTSPRTQIATTGVATQL